MKYRIFACISVLISVIHTLKAEEPPIRTSQFSVGIEKTRLIYGQYLYKNHLKARLNMSVYSEKFGFQYFRANIGYQTNIKNILLSGDYFFGSAFNGTYFNTGANLNVSAELFKRLLLAAQLSPWYDSGYGYTSCWEAKIGCKIITQIAIKIGYTTVPEYRMSEKRILGGFDFMVSKLYVSPYLSIGTKSNTGGRNIRVLFDFGYNF